MARIAGVDIPNNKQGQISLTYIYGIGRSLAKEILAKAGVDLSVQDPIDAAFDVFEEKLNQVEVLML